MILDWLPESNLVWSMTLALYEYRCFWISYRAHPCQCAEGQPYPNQEVWAAVGRKHHWRKGLHSKHVSWMTISAKIHPVAFRWTLMQIDLSNALLLKYTVWLFGKDTSTHPASGGFTLEDLYSAESQCYLMCGSLTVWACSFCCTVGGKSFAGTKHAFLYWICCST